MADAGRVRILVLALAFAVVLGGVGLAVYAASRGRGDVALDPPARADLLAWVRHLVATMPGPTSDAYNPPTPDERATMARAFEDIGQGRPEDAAALAGPLGYGVRRFTDSATGRTAVMLYEHPQRDGSFRHGWGMYVLSPDSGSPLCVEVAHPLDDIDSYITGVETYRTANGRCLFVAGASRFAGEGETADVAHEEDSVFEAVHRAALAAFRGLVVFEPHGFESTQHAGDGDVVVSSGVFPPGPVATRVADLLRGGGVRVCVYDGVHCSALGGTTNVQGVSTRAQRHEFLHVEMSRGVRRDPRLRELVARAVARAVAGPDGPEP